MRNPIVFYGEVPFYCVLGHLIDVSDCVQKVVVCQLVREVHGLAEELAYPLLLFIEVVVGLKRDLSFLCAPL